MQGESARKRPMRTGEATSTEPGDPKSGETRDTPPSPFFARPSATWTDVLPQSEHTKLLINCDYGATSLGPIQSWSSALRLYTSMVLSDSRGSCVYWGPSRIALYNKTFSQALGGAHPRYMGRALYESLPELVRDIEPVFRQVYATGQPFDVDNFVLFPERNGYPEETYFVGQFIPLLGDSGAIEGVYNTTFEITQRVLYERRRRVTDDIAAIPPLSVDGTLSKIIESLRTNPHDITAALLYSFDELAPEGTPDLRLRGSIGFPEGHHCAPREAYLDTGQDALIPVFRRVRNSGRPLVLHAADGSLQECRHLFDGVEWRGYSEPSREIVVSALAIRGQMLGFYVQATNPRREYDEATERSITDMTTQMEVKWIASISTQEARLREQLLERRATHSEQRLRHMARHAPVGMCQVGHDHKLHWANDQFYEITGLDPSKPDMADFRQCLAEDEREGSLRKLEELLLGAPRVELEMRLERTWEPPTKEDDDAKPVSAWMLASCFPLIEDGRVKLLMGYVTDISNQKWAETVQIRTADAAISAKRRQEEFIDVTSHEMRNPLTAITQLADGIASSLHVSQNDDPGFWRNTALESAAAATTILACAAHQKRIIDDVLILSRLDSQMLSITPVTAQPSNVVADTIRMFDGEVAISKTELLAAKDDSYGALNEDYYLIDTSRLTQVLINLISNAIKFTSSQPVRKISVVLGKQARRPPQLTTIFGDLHWMPPKDPERWSTVLPELTDGEEKLYLYFCVQDTGPGLTPDEIERLFKRFSQATTRTHITYGGSGLGLYVCRELAEKQGGGVGVAARSGEGSVFAFYLETRQVAAPHDGERQASIDRPRPMTETSRSSGLPRISSSQPIVFSTKILSQRDQQPQEPYQAVQEPAPPQDGGYHILLVEDNIVNQKILAKQLRKAGCTVIVANHGEEALEQLRKANILRIDSDDYMRKRLETEELQVDVILMDVEMPVLDGLECSRRIRLLEKQGQITRHLPIVATTANVRQGQVDQALAAGIDSVLSKPFTVAQAMARIGQSLATLDLKQ